MRPSSSTFRTIPVDFNFGFTFLTFYFAWQVRFRIDGFTAVLVGKAFAHLAFFLVARYLILP